MKNIIIIILTLTTISLMLSGCQAQTQPIEIKAIYPEMAKYPQEPDYSKEVSSTQEEKFDSDYEKWRENLKAQRTQEFDYTSGFDKFNSAITPAIIDKSSNENIVYSPMNIYMALSMLCEITDGNTRTQIMNLIGESNIEDIRSKANAMWNANYLDDGMTKNVLANSVWLDQKIEYNELTLQNLADYYMTSSYAGDMTSKEFNEKHRQWINEQTGGLLKDSVSALKFPKDCILGLTSTIYFKDKWDETFEEFYTKEMVFHGATQDIKCDFMQSQDSDNYYYSDNFAAIKKSFVGDSKMWFILPDEGINANELACDIKTMEFINTNGTSAENKFLIVNKYIPKFDIKSTTELKPVLNKLGVIDAFDITSADFSPTTKQIQEIFIGKAEHSARVKIDEEGCEAAAYTVLMASGAAMPPEEKIDFILNRPFIFAITSYDGLPMFIGIVNEI